jgi:hypothetical protein
MRMWRTAWGRALLIGTALGSAGVSIGLAVGMSRDADLGTSAAWGLYAAGAALLFFGASPLLAPPTSAAMAATMPDAVREQWEQRQRERIRTTPQHLLNFLVAALLIGIGALLDIYG